MKYSLSILVLVLGFFSNGCHRTNSAPAPELTVAAAADLGPAFEEIGRDFEQHTKTKVVFSFGSTGLLAQQIANGAPMDLFAAANVSYIDELEKKGLIISDTKTIYARGRITLWTVKDAKFKPTQITDLTQPTVTRIAIANPDHAPYGVAAREALQSAGIWDQVKPKLIYADNIRQALQFAQTGNVEVALVALSLSLNSNGSWVLVPESLHQPLDQACAVIKSTRHESQAREFATFLKSEQGRAVLRKYGFTIPGEVR
ncbi:MAG TPA: molybdate ABC transporter substrate-binding protein [Pyrinomonadaceae bacterium]